MSFRNLQSAIDLSNLCCGNVNVLKDVSTVQDVLVGRNLEVTQDVQIDGDVVVAGTYTADSLSVTNNASVGGTLGVTGTSTLGVVNSGEITSTDDVNCINVVASGNVTGVDLNATNDVNAESTAGLLTGFNLQLTGDLDGTVTNCQISGDLEAGSGVSKSYVTGFDLTFRKRGRDVTVFLPTGITWTTSTAPDAANVVYLNKTDSSLLFANGSATALPIPSVQFALPGPRASINAVLRTTFFIYANTYNMGFNSIGGNWDSASNSNTFSICELRYSTAL